MSVIIFFSASKKKCFVEMMCKQLIFDVRAATRLIGAAMVFNVTFNNISVITWQSVTLAEETKVPRENHRPATKR